MPDVVNILTGIVWLAVLVSVMVQSRAAAMKRRVTNRGSDHRPQRAE